VTREKTLDDQLDAAGIVGLPLRRRRRRLSLGRWSAPLGIAGAVVAVAWIVVAVIAPLIAPHDPLAQNLPVLQPPGHGTLMGTDALGRDVFSRLLAGASVTIPLSLLLVGMSVLIGAILGAIAGFFGRGIDEVIMRITDLVMAFPTVILAMVVAAALGASLFNAVLAALIVSWPSYARLTRGLVLGLRSSNYVISGQLLGFSAFTSLRRDVAPNIVGPILVLASLDIGTAILLLSGLSFLGLGAKPPTAEWGSMVSDAIHNFDAWWLGVFPGLAILTVVIAFNLVGDALRDALDPTSNTLRGGGTTL
jgi:peptide/nickel transport system permease protein